jgi:serine/threonine protein kinase/DNA-binding NarL/FixJ family response regulator
MFFRRFFGKRKTVTPDVVVSNDSPHAKRTLLWVEDDLFIQQRIKPKLEDMGYAVLTANDPDSAMDLFARHLANISLVILDVMMPSGKRFNEKQTMGGFETGVVLARWIRERSPMMPLVAFSLSTEHEATEWFLRHGSAYVEKSYDGTSLLDCVQTILSTATKGDTTTETIDADPVHVLRPLPIGYRLGRYEVRKSLGQGAMGEVYLCWDDELQRNVAIRVPRRERFKSDKDMEQVLDEARTVAKLRHSNIVSIYDILRLADGTPFIVMEYVEGNSLRQLVNSKRPSVSQIRQVICSVAEALQFAHSAGFVHRDVKPENILLDQDSIPKLADFGLAIHEHNQEQVGGAIAGTVPYMAPEQVRGQADHLDGRTDIWALGVVFYEMLTGQRPFNGESWNEVRDEILNREPTPPRMTDASIPEKFERICLKCLRKPVGERYATARDLMKDLRGEHEVVDWEVALKEVKGDYDLLLELTEVSVEETFPLLQMLEREIIDHSPHLRTTAHTLKGSLKIFGAVTVVELARRMEQCGIAGDFSEANRIFPALKVEVDRVLIELTSWLQEQQPRE